MEIVTRSGKRYVKEVAHPLGDDRENPMSQAQLEDKFRNCASFSFKKIPGSNVEKIIELVSGLDDVEDATDVLRCL